MTARETHKPTGMAEYYATRQDGVRMDDWHSIGTIVLGMEAQIENADDFDAVLRTVRWDARLVDPASIQKRHLRLALRFIQMGRDFERRR